MSAHVSSVCQESGTSLAGEEGTQEVWKFLPRSAPIQSFMMVWYGIRCGSGLLRMWFVCDVSSL